MRLLIIFYLLTGICNYCWAQNTIAVPEIISYSKLGYSAGTQNWDIRQDRNGIMYFANNEGLLSFDGTYWKVYPLPNKTIVRSVEIAPDNRIYVGAQDEIGYFSPGKNGKLVYTSLIHLIPVNERSFTDVWDIVSYKGDVFFRTGKNKIFQLSGNKISIFKSINWLFMGLSNGMLMAQDYGKGLRLFNNGVWVPFIENENLPENSLVTAFLPYGNDSSLIVTMEDGVYLLAGNKMSKLQNRDLDMISARSMYSAAIIDEDRYIFSTSGDGAFITDKKGNLIQHFSRKEGLQNHSILSTFLDKDKNIWLGLDNGIDFVAFSNAIKHIYPHQSEGSGYSSIIHDNHLYTGTSDGLYRVKLDNVKDLSFVKGDFEQVANSKGQVWNLSGVNGKLFMGHHEGAFMIEGNKALEFDKSPGFWAFLPYYNVLPSSLMVAGTYHGVNIYGFVNGKFQDRSIKVPFESARFVTIDEDIIWVAHPYKGIYKVKMADTSKPTVELYDTRKGLFSTNNNHIYKVKNRIAVTTENGICEYDPKTDRFVISEYFKNIFGKITPRYLKEDPSGNIWFVIEKNLGVIDLSGEKPQLIFFPELNRKLVSGFEHIFPLDARNIFIGGEKGFFHLNYEEYKKNSNQINVQVRTVRAMGKKDSLLFGGYFSGMNGLVQDGSSMTEVSHAWNSFHFEFSSTLFGQQSSIEYSFYLKGFDKSWSQWSGKTEKEYTNLPSGNYVFQVKARNNLGNESPVSEFAFYVQPPWYRTYAAYAVYTLLFLVGIYFIYLAQRKKFRRQQHQHAEEQKNLQYLHQLELDKNEKEIVKLRNEKLESEINHKNSELASVAMHLVHKGELLGKIKEELMRIKKQQDANAAMEEFKKLIRILSEDDKMDKDWEHFAQHFDKVHSDFLVALKNKYTSLTANELKLCAYLRMNLSSKEIAQLMNISVRGVEISRYRLRKKLNLAKDENLFNYLMNFHLNGKDVVEVNG